MAQAARLNLRMQKELKLLIADPPPGATFPSLSSHSSVVSLSSIDAQIKGPEGSVYEKGIFKLKIRIPERYPFQPPSVTFVTPIYHPNIDTGGRICLDILNLPPKGAWQPSLNISTVLTSIGLLLSEPNPDDGLMHEASREHKYNRQVFDQKARSMTEKYAVVGAKVENVAQGSQIIATSSTELGEAKEFDSSTTLIHDHSLSQKRNFEVSRKLSLESSDFDATRNDGKVVNEVPTCNLDDSHVEILQLKQRSEATLIEHEKVHKDLQDPRKKLSLGLLVPVQKKNDDNIIDVMPISTISQHHIPMDPTKSRPSVQPGFSSQQHLNADKNGKLTLNVTETKLKRKLHKPTTSLRQGTGEDDKKLLFAPQQSAVQFSSDSHHTLIPGPQTTSKQNVVDGQGSSFPRIKHKKLGLSGRRLSQEKLGWNQCPQMNNKGNMAPNSGFSLSHIQKKLTSSSEVSEAGNSYNNSGQISTNSSSRLSGTGQIKTSNPSESADGKNIGLQLEIQSEYQSRPPSMQNDDCNDEKQQLKDYGERFTSAIKVQEETSPSADDDAIIVLDSEDSEEEQDRTKSSKLSLARRRFTGKRKSQNTNLTIRENTREILKTVSQ